MKKLILALMLLAALALPVFANGNFRVSGSLDFGDVVNSSIGVSAHAQYAPLVVGSALRVGGGATFQLPLGDWSELAIYATGMVYPLNFSGGNNGWYAKLNLGFGLPLITSDYYGGASGGFYWAIGTGYEITETLFAEIVYASFPWKYDLGLGAWGGTFSASLGVIHLAVGARF